MFRRLGFSPDEFELVSWMTGWALCGHECPAGQGAGEDEGDGEEGGAGEAEASGGDAAATEAAAETAALGEGEAEGGGAGAKRKRGLEGEGGQDASGSSTGKAGQPSEEAKAVGGYVASLSRDRKISIGAKCKQLIDQGRLEWLRGLASTQRAELVSYCLPEVSGENRLLLASTISGSEAGA
jgi:tRNA:m4X modification enzyme